jgi:hypothetical protein
MRPKISFAIVFFLLPVLVMAAKGVHPVVADFYLIGGTKDGKWMSGEQMRTLVKGGEQYRIYSLTKYLGQGVGGKVSVEPPGETNFTEVSGMPKDPITGIAISGSWNALPRTPKVQSTSQKAYQDAVRSVLNSKGLAGAKVNITQVIRVDLEGDGQEEVLVSATTPRPRYPEPNSQKNDYSVVLLRKLVSGKVKTFVVEGDFYPKFVEFNAPNVYDVAAVLDFDGDGIMEIALSWGYYEGEGVDVFSYRGGKLTRVLTGGSGA